MPLETILGFYELNNSQNIKDVKNAATKISAPGLNVMYGDKFGNIAYWAAAKITKFEDTSYSDRIQSYKNAPIGYYDFSENPQSVNPFSGFVYSANNQPDSINGILYPGYYASEDRSVRILEYFNILNMRTINKMMNMQTDVKSPVMPKTSDEILKNIDITILAISENHKKAYLHMCCVEYIYVCSNFF